MPKSRPPYLHREVTRHGKVVWYVQRSGDRRCRVRDFDGSPEFWAEYRAAMEGAPPKRDPVKPQTLQWALDRYRHSSAWASLSPATRRQRENIYRKVIASAGTWPLATITDEVIVDGRERRAPKPHSANNFLKAMRGFFKWAANPKQGDLVAIDPTVGVTLLAGPNDEIGWHTWTEDEVERFEARWAIGTRERLALDLMLYTGLSRGDVVRLGRQHVRDGVITLRTEKKRGDGVVILPMLPILADTIAASPTGDLTYLVTARGAPFSKESFGNWFRDTCIEAKVPGRAHGLRKAGATRAAENGASERQLMSLFNWSTAKMATHYTRAADKKRLASESAEMLVPAHKQNKKRSHLRSGAKASGKTALKSGA